MTLTLRPAAAHDLAALCHLEQVALSKDRFSRRQLYHLLHGANALTVVADGSATGLAGYGTLLMRRNSRQARLYSFCVHPRQRGRGLGRDMLRWLMREAIASGCERMVLEVRVDNPAALALYRQAGFLPEAWLTAYYEDGCSAWRMSRALAAPGPDIQPRIAAS
ncbi:GNAT family N-acetyltransferase [Halomonas halmophila]|uniref:N-acetyltransferase domain-containing protein n=1 Tax=Halomonas halmophila TaxID=252 RepID=A0A4Y4F2M3_9GAMM|nr:GNAT family N-acetyltransferase [Halomonas halmophila]GED21388.1 hypothetical protein HHA01_03650 [Halomonas halmophila]